MGVGVAIERVRCRADGGEEVVATVRGANGPCGGMSSRFWDDRDASLGVDLKRSNQARKRRPRHR